MTAADSSGIAAPLGSVLIEVQLLIPALLEPGFEVGFFSAKAADTASKPNTSTQRQKTRIAFPSELQRIRTATDPTRPRNAGESGEGELLHLFGLVTEESANYAMKSSTLW